MPPPPRPKPPSWAVVRRIARETFGVTAFRPGQRPLIAAALEGRDALGILPTGGGKSLCFQLPALLLPGVILVVSPLIALMDDQTARLEEREVAAAKLDSTLTADEERGALSGIRRETTEIVYVTPERLEKPESLALFRDRGVSLLVVDEAHCVSQWGHDFRPAYLAIRDARKALGNPPVLGLTATATSEVATDILAQLGVRDALVVRADTERPNIFFEVRRTPSEDAKRGALAELLTGPSAQTPAIVYATTIKTVEETFSVLLGMGVRAARYHGRLGKRDRVAAQQAFMGDEVDVMVATSAFGMGIDKPDVRLVVHASFPDSLETYVQEAGRAGRDGRPARATLLYRLEDRRVQAFFLGGKYPRPADFLRVWSVLGSSGERVPLRALATRSGLPERAVKVIVAQLDAMAVVERGPRGVRPLRAFRDDAELEAFLTSYEGRFDTDRDKLEQMMRYAQSTACRTRTILTYFGEEQEDGACGHCDSCRDGPMVIAAEVPPAVRPGSPEPDEPGIPPGTVVRHRTFGVGIVRAATEERVRVDFERVGERTVHVDFLRVGPRPDRTGSEPTAGRKAPAPAT